MTAPVDELRKQLEDAIEGPWFGKSAMVGRSCYEVFSNRKRREDLTPFWYYSNAPSSDAVWRKAVYPVPAKRNRTGTRTNKSDYIIDRGRLTHTVATHQRDDFSLADRNAGAE